MSADHDGYCGWLSVGPGSSAGGVVLTCNPATKQIASVQGGMNLGGVEMPDVASGPSQRACVASEGPGRCTLCYTTPDIDPQQVTLHGRLRGVPLWLGYVAGVYPRDGLTACCDYGCCQPASDLPKGRDARRYPW